MRIITCAHELLQKLSATSLEGHLPPTEAIVTGLSALDGLFPHGALARGAVHEVLCETPMPPALFPLLLAKAAAKSKWVVWNDSRRRFHPPAAMALGLSLERLLVLRPNNPVDELWALGECLKCAGVGACVAAVGRLSRVQARRLQLAAEKGGGIGILLRPQEALSWPYAAATRWLVSPAPGETTLGRCRVKLIHGHGGRQEVLLEVCRETHHVRAIEAVAHRPPAAAPAIATA